MPTNHGEINQSITNHPFHGMAYEDSLPVYNISQLLSITFSYPINCCPPHYPRKIYTGLYCTLPEPRQQHMYVGAYLVYY